MNLSANDEVLSLWHRLHEARVKLCIAHAQRDVLAAKFDGLAEKANSINSASLIPLAAAERFTRNAEAEMIDLQQEMTIAIEGKKNRRTGM